MGKYFVRDTPLAGLEREMMLPPNFTPRGSSSAILCGYSPHGAGVDCRSCIDHRRQSRRTLVCLHITERLQVGAVTIVELAAETVRPWKHPGLKQRAVGIAGRLKGLVNGFVHGSNCTPSPTYARLLRSSIPTFWKST